MMFPSPQSTRLCLLVLCLPLLAFAAGEEKVYVAVEGEGTVAVFDASSRQLLKRIDLAGVAHGMRMPIAPHNVQVAPDGSALWVTANSGHQGHGKAPPEENHEGMAHPLAEPPADEVIVIDPATDTVIRRIPLAPGLHLAHVVLTPDGAKAFVTAQNTGAIHEIDAKEYRVARTIQAPPGSQPHGLRVSPDGKTAYVALLQGKGLGILDVASGQLRVLPLDGAPVQTAVTPDGRYALASLYDTKKLAVHDTGDQSLRYIELLGSARGPVQLYPTPDSHYAYVADQGHYFGEPDSEWVYKVDLRQLKTVWSIKAGRAPHGIAIDRDGHYAYITNLVGGDLSVIDLSTDREVARLPVGAEPNGVSIWNSRTGGAP